MKAMKTAKPGSSLAQADACIEADNALAIKLPSLTTMAPMKAMKTAKSMTKGAIAEALVTEFEMKKTACSKLIDSLVVIPGVCMIKTRVKPARKAGKRMAFGKEVMVKAQPAKTVVKAFPVSALKRSI